jgi:hypothetical protein
VNGARRGCFHSAGIRGAAFRSSFGVLLRLSQVPDEDDRPRSRRSANFCCRSISGNSTRRIPIGHRRHEWRKHHSIAFNYTSSFVPALRLLPEMPKASCAGLGRIEAGSALAAPESTAGGHAQAHRRVCGFQSVVGSIPTWDGVQGRCSHAPHRPARRVALPRFPQILPRSLKPSVISNVTHSDPTVIITLDSIRSSRAEGEVIAD